MKIAIPVHTQTLYGCAHRNQIFEIQLKKERKAKKWIRSVLFISTSSSELRKVALAPHEKQIPLPHHQKTIRNQRILAA